MPSAQQLPASRLYLCHPPAALTDSCKSTRDRDLTLTELPSRLFLQREEFPVLEDECVRKVLLDGTVKVMLMTMFGGDLDGAVLC